MAMQTLDLNLYHFYDIGGVDELPNGERLFLDIGDKPIVVFNIAGYFYAIGDMCTHDSGPLGDGDIDGFEIACPRHGARFDIRNGSVLTPPATSDTPAYPVRVVGDRLEIGILK